MSSAAVGTAQKSTYTLVKTITTTYAPITFYFSEFGPSGASSINIVNLSFQANVYKT